jgi:hypothetical protein
LEKDLDREDAVRRLLILSSKRDLAKTVAEEGGKMPFAFDVSEDSYLRELVQKGVRKCEARFMRHALEAQFGTLPEWAQTKINEASEETLERWVGLLHKATSLEELLNQ